MRTWIKGWLAMRRLQSLAERKEMKLNCMILRSQLKINKLTLKQMKSDEDLERRTRHRNAEHYIC